MNQMSRRDGWLWRHPAVSVAILAGSILVITVVVVELGLRSLGYSYTRKPEKLVISDSFVVNSRGFFVANPLSKAHKGSEINQEGFRSPEFYAQDKGGARQITLLLIGDSFVWGATANPLTKSFADLVRLQGHRVHNLGIPGTGPRQYQRLAAEYIPLLQPDVVVIGLYLGNDFLDPQWDPPQGRPPYHILEFAEWISPFDEEGRYIENVDEAYEHFHNKFGRVRRVLRETAIGTMAIKMYRTLMAWLYERQKHAGQTVIGWTGDLSVSGSSEKLPEFDAVKERYRPTYEALHEIQAITQRYRAQYYTMVIPALGAGCLVSQDFSLEVQREALREYHPLFLDVAADHYTGIPDCHFNNKGHRVVADSLLKLLHDFKKD